jgi:hypothetical protein
MVVGGRLCGTATADHPFPQWTSPLLGQCWRMPVVVGTLCVAVIECGL